MPALPLKCIERMVRTAERALPCMKDGEAKDIGRNPWAVTIRQNDGGETLTLRHYGTSILLVARVSHSEPWRVVGLCSGAYSASDRDGINSLLLLLGIPASARIRGGKLECL